MSLHTYQLKYIALITMIIDHCGIVFANQLSPSLYIILRGIGRISFPVFCFLLVEGFFHTSNRNRYLSRLLLFSFLSEIPFDLAIRHTEGSSLLTLMDWTEQNIFFTLAFGFLAMMLIEHYQYSTLCWVCSAIFFSCLADVCHTDYGATGVITILLLYLRKKNPDPIPLWLCLIPLLATAIKAPVQLSCVLSLLFLTCYNGEKGTGPKYLFYAAYPVHLFLLYLLSL